MAAEKRMIDLLADEYEQGVQTITFMGREIRVRPMVYGEYRTIAALFPDNTAKQQAEAVIRMCRYPDGSPVFTRDDRATLSNATRMERIGQLIAIIYGRTTEEAVKNSEAGDPQTTSAMH